MGVCVTEIRMSSSDTLAALSPVGVKTFGPTVRELPAAGRGFLLEHGTERKWCQEQEVQRHHQPVGKGCWRMEGRICRTVIHSDGGVQSLGGRMQDELHNLGNLLTGAASRLSMHADAATARALRFDKALLLQMSDTVPGTGLGIAAGLARRMMQLDAVIDVGGLKTLQDKLCFVLDWFSKRRAIAGRDASVALRVAQTEPAEGVGTSRPRAQIKLQNLRDLGEIGLA